MKNLEMNDIQEDSTSLSKSETQKNRTECEDSIPEDVVNSVKKGIGIGGTVTKNFMSMIEKAANTQFGK
ncbi:MAG: hypothetical protein FWF54_09185 [Candidatus Azobacteroides sp.]|nr:hypothetical protein [Candidatus Azobacteroides sp.]